MQWFMVLVGLRSWDPETSISDNYWTQIKTSAESTAVLKRVPHLERYFRRWNPTLWWSYPGVLPEAEDKLIVQDPSSLNLEVLSYSLPLGLTGTPSGVLWGFPLKSKKLKMAQKQPWPLVEKVWKRTNQRALCLEGSLQTPQKYSHPKDTTRELKVWL